MENKRKFERINSYILSYFEWVSDKGRVQEKCYNILLQGWKILLNYLIKVLFYFGLFMIDMMLAIISMVRSYVAKPRIN